MNFFQNGTLLHIQFCTTFKTINKKWPMHFPIQWDSLYMYAGVKKSTNITEIICIWPSETIFFANRALKSDYYTVSSTQYVLLIPWRKHSHFHFTLHISSINFALWWIIKPANIQWAHTTQRCVGTIDNVRCFVELV